MGESERMDTDGEAEVEEICAGVETQGDFYEEVAWSICKGRGVGREKGATGVKEMHE
jgi:hypothetical protein